MQVAARIGNLRLPDFVYIRELTSEHQRASITKLRLAEGNEAYGELGRNMGQKVR